ncbi:sodium/proline symporter PutP [candidate division KSB1 bacterium]|nr:sodium/proline symporter PutP [candidate division KSB1 bacterium]
MFQDTWYIAIPFIGYILFMLGIGVYQYRRTKNIDDYILGSRGLGRWVASLSAQASDMSGWLLLGLPGYAYLAGLEAGWIALGLLIGTYLNWRFVAYRLRLFTEIAGNAITLPDYFENRFAVRSRRLRVIAALFILIFFLIYTASGFVAGAKLFSTVFGLPYILALGIGIFVIISYTFLGGFLAVCWTDFFQGIIMFLAILIVPILALREGGGMVWSQLRDFNPHTLNPFTNASGDSLGFFGILSLMAWGLGYFGQPHILARFMAIKRPDHIPYARRIAMIWVMLSLTAALFVGLTAHGVLLENLDASTSETVFMVLVGQLVTPLLAGFLLAAVLAAIMSTADSQLLVASSAIAEDLYGKLFRKQASQSELVWISRFAVIGIAIIAGGIALNPESSVLSLVAYAWAGFGATFGPLILFSLFWKRMTEKGAFFGIIGGGLTVLIWKQLSGGLFDLYEIVPGFLISCILIIICSLADKPPAQSVHSQFDRMHDALHP